LRYLAHLRSENRRSPRAAADAEHASAKAALLRLRIAEKKRELIPLEEAACGRCGDEAATNPVLNMAASETLLQRARRHDSITAMISAGYVASRIHDRYRGAALTR
jgi:hypothetical protein